MSFLRLSLKNKDYWLEEALSFSQDWNDQPESFAVNLAENLSPMKRHSSAPLHPYPLILAGNLIDSVNLQQAISAVLDPLLQGD